jgi:hypothetical protein
MTVHILSKMTDSVKYNTYNFIGNKSDNTKQNLLPISRNDGVLIRGGAGRPSQKIGFGDRAQDPNGNVLWTPAGVVTTITDQEYDRLKDHWLFKKHLENGVLEVVTSDVVDNHKKVKLIAEDMPRDGAALLSSDVLAEKLKVKIPLLSVEE